MGHVPFGSLVSLPSHFMGQMYFFAAAGTAIGAGAGVVGPETFCSLKRSQPPRRSTAAKLNR